MWFWISLLLIIIFVLWQFIDTSECEHEYIITGAMIEPHPAHIRMGMSETRKLSDYCGRYSDDCEVIGNIHENPELIK